MAIYVRSKELLRPYPVKLTERLERWASEAPDRVFLGIRTTTNHWRTIAYRDFHLCVRKAGQALLNRRLNANTPIAIVSGNCIEHAILAVAAMYVGVPYSPIAPSHSPDRFLRVLNPSMVFAAATDVNSLLETPASSEVDRAHESITADHVAKILFTSGSTGAPHGVINTQRMLTSNQEMILTTIPWLRDRPPILCDWLPWHHTFGGNHNFGIALYNGGTLFIDEGRPEAMERSIRNLREIAPTVYFNVPRGFEALAKALRQDAEFTRQFFSRLQVMFCAGASLPQQTRDELSRLSNVPIVTGFGATETAPLTISSIPGMTGESAIGLPVPGVELKLVPTSGKLELCVRGPNVSPGVALDEEGFYRTGDTVRFADPEIPSLGLIFDGRLAENFKLSTGTWVNVDSLRADVMRCCDPYLSAVVIAGENRNYVTALLFPTPRAATDLSLPGKLTRALKAMAARNGGCSRRIGRATVVKHALLPEAGEITSKGSVNQKAVLANRADLITTLYSTPPPRDVVVIVE